MNVVIVKHHTDDEREYLFKVPGRHYLKAGDLVLCDTQFGTALGFCMCDSFELSDEENRDTVCRMFRIEEPTRYILGRYSYYKYDDPSEDKN